MHKHLYSSAQVCRSFVHSLSYLASINIYTHLFLNIQEQTSSEETDGNKIGHRQKKGCLISQLHLHGQEVGLHTELKNSPARLLHLHQSNNISFLYYVQVEDRRLQTGTEEQWTKRTLTTAP